MGRVTVAWMAPQNLHGFRVFMVPYLVVQVAKTCIFHGFGGAHGICQLNIP